MIPRATNSALLVVVTLQCALFIASSAAAVTPACPRQCECFAAAASNGTVQAANCTDLPAGQAQTWPQNVLRIRLERGTPVVLKNEAFKRFPRLAELDIAGGTIHYVGRSAFGGLPELLDVGLVRTGVRKLHRDTFADNRKLAFVSLEGNPALIVGPSFLVSVSVTDLDLSACALKSLKSAYFRGLPNLKNLFASRNALKVLGARFGPPGLKYADLGHNRIERVADDLEAYKRLRTIDLTGNPVDCTCELSEVDRRLASRGVAFGNTVRCENTGKPLDDMAEACSDKDAMGDAPANMYQAEDLIRVDDKTYRPTEDELDDSGSGSGDGGGGGFVSADPVAKSSPDRSGGAVDTATAAKDAGETARPTEKTAAEGGDSVEQTAGGNGGKNASAEQRNTTAAVGTNGTDEEAVTGTRQTTAGNSPSGEAKKTLVASGTEITYDQMKAPKDELPVTRRDDDGAALAEYLKSNVGVAGAVAASLLLVVLVAVAYAATRLRRRRRRWSTGGAAEADGKELKEIKYVAASAEDDGRGDDGSAAAGPADNLLADRDTDDDDDDDDEGGEGEHGGGAGSADGTTTLLSSVLDAVKDDRVVTPDGSPDVPTRVTVKLTETPKASRPVTINNVH